MPEATQFGWKIGLTHLEPVTIISTPFPELTTSLTSCKCFVTKCKSNCSCQKMHVPCCVACKYEGKKGKCDRVAISETITEVSKINIHI